MNQSQVKSFYTAVNRLNRAYGGTDTDHSGLWRAYQAHEQRTEQNEAARKAREEAKRIEDEKQAAINFEREKEEAQYLLSPEFREEVISELIAEGATRLQAEGRTRDSFHLLKEAQRLNLV